MADCDPKPNLRGLHHATAQRNIFVAVALCCGWILSAKLLFTERRKKAYRDFYRDYDPQKSFERMRKAGVFQSVSAEDEEEDEGDKKKKK